jgi:hypothetical protein
VALLTGLMVAGLAACGGGERQDADEPSGEFPVEIVTSKFATRQRLAQTSFLRLGVRNSGDKTIPNMAITIFVDPNAIRPFSIRDPQTDLAAPDRPVWILENEYPKLATPGGSLSELESAPTAGAETANSKTFAFGSVGRGDEVDAVWKLTPVRAGDFTVHYRVDAGLTGKAKAVTADDSPATGEFVVRISSTPPQTRVNDQGQVVVIQGKRGTVVKGPKGNAAVVEPSGSQGSSGSK